jgi:ankyrin repeat protein
MFRDAVFETGRDADLEDGDDIFWDAPDSKSQVGDRQHENGRDQTGPIYGAEDVDDRWTLLHSACYNGSPKVKELLLLKGADPEHLEAIMLEDNPTILPMSPF